jgi:hypothetical protein
MAAAIRCIVHDSSVQVRAGGYVAAIQLPSSSSPAFDVPLAAASQSAAKQRSAKVAIANVIF